MILRLSSALICLLFVASTASAQCSSCAQGSAPVFGQGVSAPMYSSNAYAQPVNHGLAIAPLRFRTNAYAPQNCCMPQNCCAPQTCCGAQSGGVAHGCCGVSHGGLALRRGSNVGNNCSGFQGCNPCMPMQMLSMPMQSAPTMAVIENAAPVEMAQQPVDQSQMVQDATFTGAPVAPMAAAVVGCCDAPGVSVMGTNVGCCPTAQPAVGCCNQAPARRVSLFGGRRGARCCY
jgi:hypothetical protein